MPRRVGILNRFKNLQGDYAYLIIGQVERAKRSIFSKPQ